MMQALNLKARI